MSAWHRGTLTRLEVSAPEPRQECQTALRMSVGFAAGFLLSAAEGVRRQSAKEGNKEVASQEKRLADGGAYTIKNSSVGSSASR